MLNPATLTFLQKLAKNNNKPWFDSNRNLFEAAKADFEQVVGRIIKQLGKTDEDIAMLTAKECTFRQYRDVRFSKDKTPYKINMGASMDRDGKKSGFAGYYFHLEPGDQSMVGGGLWMPEAAALKKVRQEIDYCREEFLGIVQIKSFIKHFGDLERGEYSLSREPKGYEKDNPVIEYLKLKSFVAIRKVNDEELLSKGLVEKAVSSFEALTPLIKFINRALSDTE